VTIVDGACRSCGARPLQPVVDLGAMPLANALIKRECLDEPEERFPLHLTFCERCSLAQITESVPPEKLFGDYLYFSSFSDTMLRHCEAIAERVVRERRLSATSLVMEVASNDGYLLQFYRRAGVRVLGVEPAANIARVAENERKIPTLCAFFGSEIAAQLARDGMRADVLHANNVIAHVADLNGFVRGIATVLKEDGVAIIETPSVRDMVERLEFDTIYHEHLHYFSLASLDSLFARHGLSIVDVEHVSIHGGSLRIFVTPSTAGRPPSPAFRTMLQAEVDAGTTGPNFYRDFGARIEALKHKLTALIAELKAAGKSIAAYGASAKGSTLLNAFGIGAESLDFVVDRSSYKQGLYTPGTHLPIFAPTKLLDAKPDYLLLLTWNLESEILAQQEEYRRRGGRFIVPVPDVRIV